MTAVEGPTVFASPETVAGVRGRAYWNLTFAIIAVAVPVWFGSGVARATGDSDRGSLATFSLFACFALCRIVHLALARNQVGFLSFSLGAQFFLRGALLSVFLAMIMEVVAMVYLGPNHSPLKDVPIAILVGFSEEVSKLLFVLIGLNLLPHALPQQLILPPAPNDRYTSCVRWWSTLVESPRALAMAGIAAGFGFMTCENIEYFTVVFYSQAPVGDTMAMVLFRVFLNLHPLLTGLAAARLAREVYVGTSIKSVTIGRVTRAIYPSILIHAAFDFGLMFSTTNPDKTVLDDTFITVSLVLIPFSIGLLVWTYRSLPKNGSTSLLVTNS
jgi:RsiW-degrading membrane proteinase PrsW (M82 family)